jgi:hypothetical protein
MQQRGAVSVAHPGQAGTEVATGGHRNHSGTLVQLTSASMAATFGLLWRAAGKKMPVSDTSGPPRCPPWSSLARIKTPIPFGYVLFPSPPLFFSLMNRDLGAFVTARGLCRWHCLPTRLPPTRLPPPCQAASPLLRPVHLRPLPPGLRAGGGQDSKVPAVRAAGGALRAPSRRPRGRGRSWSWRVRAVTVRMAKSRGKGGGVGASGAGGSDRGRWWWAREAAGQVPRVPRGAD